MSEASGLPRKSAVVLDLDPARGAFADRVGQALASLGATAVAIERLFDADTQAEVAFDRRDDAAVPDVNVRLAPFGVAVLPDAEAGSQ